MPSHATQTTLFAHHMSSLVFVIISLLAYGLATGLIVKYIRSATEQAQATHLLTKASAIALLALACHLVAVYQHCQSDGNLNVSLSSMLILVSAILAITYGLASAFLPIRRLGVLVYPFIILCLVAALLWQSEDSIAVASTQLSIHILLSLSAYALLSIATIQALLYVYQERQLKHNTKTAMLMALPPLQTMEALLFKMLGIGFVLLSLTLLSGVVFSQQLFGHAFEFKHHTVLALLGWMVFGILLFKRVKYGLRGEQAVAWTVAGFICIQLGYFGTKFVAESLS